MAKILGLDISSQSTGVAVLNDGKLLKSSFELIKPNPKWQYGHRLSFFRDELKRIIKKHEPEHIVIEDIYKGRNIKTFKILSMWRGVAVQTIYEETSIEPVSFMPTDSRSILELPFSKEEAFISIVEKCELVDFNFEEHNDIVDAVGLVLAMDTLLKQGKNARSLQDSRRRKKRKRSRNKKSL